MFVEPWTTWSLKTLVPYLKAPVQLMRAEGSTTPSVRAAAARTILNVEPGGYRVIVARLKRGFDESVLRSFQRSGGVTPPKAVRSKSGLLARQITPPSAGSIAATAPRLSARSDSARACTPPSMAR